MRGCFFILLAEPEPSGGLGAGTGVDFDLGVFDVDINLSFWSKLNCNWALWHWNRLPWIPMLENHNVDRDVP